MVFNIHGIVNEKKNEAIVHIKMAHRIVWTWIIMYIVATMNIHTGKQTMRIQQRESLCEHLLIGGGA